MQQSMDFYKNKLYPTQKELTDALIQTYVEKGFNIVQKPGSRPGYTNMICKSNKDILKEEEKKKKEMKERLKQVEEDNDLELKESEDVQESSSYYPQRKNDIWEAIELDESNPIVILYNKFNIPQLKDILKNNSQRTVGNKKELVARCVFGHLNGAMQHCSCGAFLAFDFAKSSFVCLGLNRSGVISKCIEVKADVKFSDWKKPIPPDIQVESCKLNLAVRYCSIGKGYY